MPNKEKNIPKRRFKAFENADAWELRKLGEYSTLITKGTTPRDKSGIGVVNFVKVENLVNGDIIPLQKIQLEEHEGYLKRSQLIENDILFSIAGTLGRTAIVKKSILPANTNQALSIIRGYEFDRNFLVTILRGVVVREFIKKNPTIGAQPNLSLEQVSNLCFLTPCSEEQSAIGTFFSTLDQQITLHQRKLDKLKSVKQAYLSEMFPAEGERVPKRRFPGFTDDWELRPLGEIGNTYTGLSGKTKDDFGHGDGRFVTYMNVFSNPISLPEMVEAVEIDESQNTVRYGDVLFTTSSETPEEVGMSSVWLENTENTYLNSFCFGFRPVKKVNPYYLAYLLRSSGMRRKISFLAQGISRYNISKTKMMELEISIPNEKEQSAIGTFFSTLDRQITLHQRKSI
ncbi:restriction endonuclease subunit S [Streptococcus suis]|nr:restriction endonuclease subunit S [Streptococcus suis]HEM5494308.1 restriction endonuclease subunit S [Streptococcus suis]